MTHFIYVYLVKFSLRNFYILFRCLILTGLRNEKKALKTQEITKNLKRRGYLEKQGIQRINIRNSRDARNSRNTENS